MKNDLTIPAASPPVPVSQTMDPPPPPSYNEGTSLLNPPAPLPDTSYPRPMEIQHEPCIRISEACIVLQATSLDSGQALLETCTSNPDIVGGLSTRDLFCSGLTGFGLGGSLFCSGALLNAAARRSENPRIRLAGMYAADACMVAACALWLTPAAPVAGAAALGHTSGSALTTAASAWAVSVPYNLACSYLFHKCCCPRPEGVTQPNRSRKEQYQAVHEAGQRRGHSIN